MENINKQGIIDFINSQPIKAVENIQKKKNITCTLRYRQISSLRRFG